MHSLIKHFGPLMRQPRFVAAALGHLSVDILNGQMGVLLAVLSVPLALSNADIGLVSVLYAFVGSLTQPLFGWLSDKFGYGGGRWASVGGVIWMASWFSLAALTPNSGYWPIVWLILGSLGSAAFHPPGTMQATRVGQAQMAGKAATAASIFFLFGQMGLSLGPALGGLIMDNIGLGGLLWVTLPMLTVGGYMAGATRAPLEEAAEHQSPTATAPRAEWALFILIIALSGLRAWGQSAIATFGPKFLHDQNIAPTIYGSIIALFMTGTAVGGVIGGMMGDRWDERRILTVAPVLSILPFYLFPLASGGWLYVVALIAGLTNGAPHSLLVTMAQRALPGKAAMATGLALGFMFTASSLGTYLSGLLADQVGLRLILQGNALIAATTAALSLVLYLAKKRPQMVVAPAGD